MGDLEEAFGSLLQIGSASTIEATGGGEQCGQIEHSHLILLVYDQEVRGI